MTALAPLVSAPSLPPPLPAGTDASRAQPDFAGALLAAGELADLAGDGMAPEDGGSAAPVATRGNRRHADSLLPPAGMHGLAALGLAAVPAPPLNILILLAPAQNALLEPKETTPDEGAAGPAGVAVGGIGTPDPEPGLTAVPQKAAPELTASGAAAPLESAEPRIPQASPEQESNGTAKQGGTQHPEQSAAAGTPQPVPGTVLMAVSGAPETPSPHPSSTAPEGGTPKPAREGRIAFGLNLRPIETDAAAKSATAGNTWRTDGAGGAATDGGTAGEAPAPVAAFESAQPAADWRVPQVPESPVPALASPSPGRHTAPPDLPAATDDTSSPAQNGWPVTSLPSHAAHPARQPAGNAWASTAEKDAAEASRPAAIAAGPVDADASGGREGASAQDGQRSTPGNDRRPTASSERAHDLVQPAAGPAVSPAAMQTGSTGAPAWTAEAPTQSWRTDEAPSHPPSAAGPAAPQPDPGRLPTTPARDIRIALDGGEGRVEVRIAERGGSIQVAVRTPDERLAGDLRSDLPALTARLEQAGYRADSWHPPAAPRRADAQPEPGTGEHDDGSGRHESSGQDRRRQQQEQFEPPAGRKAQRKDVTWLFPSLQ